MDFGGLLLFFPFIHKTKQKATTFKTHVVSKLNLAMICRLTFGVPPVETGVLLCSGGRGLGVAAMGLARKRPFLSIAEELVWTLWRILAFHRCLSFRVSLKPGSGAESHCPAWCSDVWAIPWADYGDARSFPRVLKNLSISSSAFGMAAAHGPLCSWSLTSLLAVHVTSPLVVQMCGKGPRVKTFPRYVSVWRKPFYLRRCFSLNPLLKSSYF